MREKGKGKLRGIVGRFADFVFSTGAFLAEEGFQQWFQVDLSKLETFNQIELDNSWACWESPNTYAMTVSNDGVTWSKPVATGKGQFGMTLIRFSVQTARYIRVTQTGSDATYHWSIFEFDVFHP